MVLHLTHQHIDLCLGEFVGFLLSWPLLTVKTLISWLIEIRIDIHEVLCIDHLWLNVGVSRAEYEAEPRAQTLRQAVIYKGEIACRCADAWFYKSGIFLAHAKLCF